MNRPTPRLVTFLALLVAALAWPFAAGEETARPSDWVRTLKYPGLNPVKPPVVVKEVLPNGVVLMMVEDHELPLIELSATVRGGLLAEPADRPGVVDLFNEAYRTGGTAAMDGDTLDLTLERIGAVVEGGAGEDAASLYGRMLKETADQVLPLFADLLVRPAFAQEKVELAKTHLKSGIARRNDDVYSLGQREMQKLLLGARHPLARQIEYADVDRLTRDDLVAFHKATFRPDQTILAVWGDFQPEAMKARLARLLAAWKAPGPAPRYPIPPFPAPAYSVNYIEKPDLEQTFISMGLLGLRYDDPDYPAVSMMATVLGGGFSSRLFVKVRTEMGLAYSAGGDMVPAYDRPGFFSFFTSTKPSTTALALQAMLDEIKRIREQPVGDEELARAKEGYLNQFAFEYDSRREVIGRQALYRFYGYPEDFNLRLRQAVEKVTAGDVLEAARKYLRPDRLTILAAGRADQFDKPLSTFGEVRVLDISIPEPPAPPAPSATPESLARGLELLTAAAKAKGEAALVSLKDFSGTGKAIFIAPQGEVELQVKYIVALPTRFRMDLVTPMGPIVQAGSEEGFWVQQGGQTMDLPPALVDEGRLSLLTDAGGLGLLREALAGKLQAQALGGEEFLGARAEVVLATALDTPIRVFLDPETWEIRGVRRRTLTEAGPQELTEVFGDYREVDGLRFPFEVRQLFEGVQRTRTLWETIKTNAGPDPAQFKKPS